MQGPSPVESGTTKEMEPRRILWGDVFSAEPPEWNLGGIVKIDQKHVYAPSDNPWTSKDLELIVWLLTMVLCLSLAYSIAITSWWMDAKREINSYKQQVLKHG